MIDTRITRKRTPAPPSDPTDGDLRQILAASRGVLDENRADPRLCLVMGPPGHGAAPPLFWGRHESTFGPVLAAATATGLCWLSFIRDLAGPSEAEALSLTDLTAAWPHSRLIHQPAATSDAIALAFIHETRLAAPLPVQLQGSEFQLKVWSALLRIPTGALVSYGDLAKAIGRPTAFRATGSAVGANPVSVLVPCHRVIGVSGSVYKYSGGPERKKALLAWELQHRFPHSPSTSAMP